MSEYCLRFNIYTYSYSMCSTCLGLTVVIVCLVIWWSNREHLEDTPISRMTAADIDALRQQIEKAVRIGQFYSDFRRMYPYPISTWTYNQMVIAHKRGLLTNAMVKSILKESG